MYWQALRGGVEVVGLRLSIAMLYALVAELPDEMKQKVIALTEDNLNISRRAFSLRIEPPETSAESS